MPSMKCPTCDYKILLPTPVAVCTNCGNPFTIPTAKTSPGRSPAPASARPYPPTPPISSSTSTPVPLGPTGASISAFGMLPATMPSRMPDLEGIIDANPIRDTIKFGDDWSSCLLKLLLLPFIILFKAFDILLGWMLGHRHIERTMTVYIARIRDLRGTTREARFEGDLMGAGLNWGDKVSLWGHVRNGTLIVKRGYNHDAGAEIRIRPPVAPWATRIIAVLLLLFMLYLAVIMCGLVH